MGEKPPIASGFVPPSWWVITGSLLTV